MGCKNLKRYGWQDTAKSGATTPTAEPRRSEHMSSWLERQASNHQIQLAAAAVLSGAVVAGVILGAQAVRRKEAVEELKATIPELSEDHKAELVRRGTAKGVKECLADCLSEAQRIWRPKENTCCEQRR